MVKLFQYRKPVRAIRNAKPENFEKTLDHGRVIAHLLSNREFVF